MAQTPTPQEKQMVDNLAAEKLGDVNAQVSQAIQQTQDAAGDPNVAGKDNSQQAVDKNPIEKPTAQEQAAEAVSPKTEGDMSQEEAFIKVMFGENDSRTLSDKQIKDTYNRYRDLNYKHQTEVAPMQPILDFAKAIQSQVAAEGVKANPNDIVQFLAAASQAYMKNPVMGGQKDPTPDTQGIPLGDIEKDMAQWEEENAISLPPQYRQAAQEMQSLRAENEQIKKMVMDMSQNAQGLNQQATQQVMQASQAQDGNMRQLAANNLDKAQAKYQLSDDLQDQFFQFAYGRGYTMEDFLDPSLTDTVVGDFKANINSPEMERLAGIAKRRQAFTGSMGATPGAVGEAPPADPNTDFIGKVADDFLKKRNRA